ncbi:holin [Caulobacter virus Karma]|uniref:holin n=1 Tax=Caulobacter virus Magneto TaxID=1211642 RepID=UPI00028BB004|nr:holin [Caulobacter virus Magneto]YP_006989488.1 holin [Caulobacter virus Karma]AFU87274.1 putative holin protein [Caulobacter virus Magneto]AFU87625.1 putative holin protein [Caulobacter virus Karma]
MTPPWIAAPLRVCGNFFRWVRLTLDTLCDRPDHLQRLSIIGSGMAAFPLIIGIIAILVHFGLHGPDSAAALATIPIIGNMGYGALALYALSQVALLGIIKGVRLSGPGGVNVEIETTSGDGDGLSDTHTTIVERGRRHGRDHDCVPNPQAGSGAGAITE